MLAEGTKNLRNIFCKTLRISTVNRFLNRVQNILYKYQEGCNSFEQGYMETQNVFMYRFLFS